MKGGRGGGVQLQKSARGGGVSNNKKKRKTSENDHAVAPTDGAVAAARGGEVFRFVLSKVNLILFYLKNECPE
jgi:hypothetical protein